MSLYYPKKKKLTPVIVEAYVEGMYDLYLELGGETHCKMYDPLTIEGKTAHSYVFNLEDGGRHHQITTLEKLMSDIKKEMVEHMNNLNEEYREVCICAAVKTEDGKIFRGHRHCDCLNAIHNAKLAPSFEQGFMTSHNRYVSRNEGYQLQKEAGIPSALDAGYMEGTLFSEDLY